MWIFCPQAEHLNDTLHAVLSNFSVYVRYYMQCKNRCCSREKSWHISAKFVLIHKYYNWSCCFSFFVCFMQETLTNISVRWTDKTDFCIFDRMKHNCHRKWTHCRCGTHNILDEGRASAVLHQFLLWART